MHFPKLTVKECTRTPIDITESAQNSFLNWHTVIAILVHKSYDQP